MATDSPIVLCIDDRREQLELRKLALQAKGFRVETATNGHAALKILEEASVAVVLLEYKEEGMDAEALASQIDQRFPKVPIILLSAYHEMPERILWLVDEYVNKSDLPDGLVHVIERVTRQNNVEVKCTLAPSTSKPVAA